MAKPPDAPQSRAINSRADVARRLKDENIRFLRLWFTDITGLNKNVEVPTSQFDKALDGQVMFDGSSIEGFVRIEESDMLLAPDFDTFRVYPWADEGRGKVARLICDVHTPDGAPFEGCPRATLKRMLHRAAELGVQLMAGPEAEFFLFEHSAAGGVTTKTNDEAGYFDAAPLDEAEACRHVITNYLEAMGLEVEASHHEVAPGQHEIDFRYANALTTADNVSTFKYVVRRVARDFGLHATFMPKPIFGINGSGMHCHLSLFDVDGKQNLFADPNAEWGISETGLHFIGGVIEHARSLCAITNPLVNSFKRLVKGYEAPTHIAWSMRNRSPMIRIPERRGLGTRMELRMPDPSCNPYLALAVILGAGLDGMQKRIAPPEPVNKNIYTMSQRERGRLRISSLPGNLKEAIDALERSPLMREVLGDHVFRNFVDAKRQEWQEYIAQVHGWELRRYLGTY
ncbi:MAG: type I glutamate--ammonia ligase [Planctomycetes bacterium]|nr:type I glutamate--ammonia ligase [Planctomycetota bacterium]